MPAWSSQCRVNSPGECSVAAVYLPGQIVGTTLACALPPESSLPRLSGYVSCSARMLCRPSFASFTTNTTAITKKS